MTWARKHAQFYIIDASKLAVSVGLGANRTNSILQAAFFALTKVIPLDMAVEDMKKNNYPLPTSRRPASPSWTRTTPPWTLASARL